MTDETANIILEILKKVQAKQASDSRVLESVQQDMRMLRSVINDFAKTNVTSGEMEAVHFDLNRLQHQVGELDARLNLLEESSRWPRA